MEFKVIPVCEPLIGKKEFKYVQECLKTGWISSNGRFISEFEEKWADYCNMKYGIAVSNGTAALIVSLGCLDLEPDDEIIMPAFTIISCALAAIYNNCKPVFIDSEPRTFTIDTTKIEEKITKKTRAIIAVHIYGHPCDMDPIYKLARKYQLAIIEDAAEAHGAEYKDKKCGSLGDISCFSFYANKIITTGEGGMLLTNDKNYAEKARAIRNLCFKKEKRFYHEELGYNFRMTNIQAAIGLAQLGRIDKLVEKKRWIGHIYNKKLKDIPGMILPVEEHWAKNVYWMYGIVLKDTAGMDALEFAERLYKLGVDTRPFFLGMHEQPVLKDMGIIKNEKHPISEMISRKGLYLPSGLTLTEDKIDFVANAVKKIL